MVSPKGPVRPVEDRPATSPRQLPTVGAPAAPRAPSPESPMARARAAAAGLRSASPPREPHDPGELLADIPRSDGTRLRVAWCEVDGHPFVRIAVWDGAWAVKGKQVSVRRGELGAVLEALILACEKASGWTP